MLYQIWGLLLLPFLTFHFVQVSLQYTAKKKVPGLVSFEKKKVT